MPIITEHVLCVDSADRNTTAYPEADTYSISLPSRYKNIWKAELLNIQIAAINPVEDYVYLSIDQLNGLDSTSNAGLNFAFAKIPFISQTSDLHYLDGSIINFGPVPLQNPIASLDKLNIKIINSAGVIVNQNGNNHNFQLRFTCADNVPRGGGSSITYDGRVLGGSKS